MTLAHSKITAQGQVSIPAQVRRRLAVVPGSVLEWALRGDEIVVRRVTRFTSQQVHDAVFVEPPKRRSLEELKAGITKHVKARHARG
jgi:AbrB family looped-hinge helix DNA binding protein